MKNTQEKNVRGLKDRAVLFAWVIGLLLLISMLWIFTQPVQSFYLMRSVNNVLNTNNIDMRLSESISFKSEKAALFGFWYSIQNSANLMYVFSVFRDGLLVPLGAVVSDEGKVVQILPLSAHAARVFNTLHDEQAACQCRRPCQLNVLQMYKIRIESSAIPVIAKGDLP